MNDPLHILFVCHECPPARVGGIGAAVLCLSRGLAQRGHHVSILGFYDVEGHTEDGGVSVHRVRYPRRSWLPRPIRLRVALRDAIRKIHRRRPIDIIEWPDYEGWYWRPLPGVTDVVKVHGTKLSHRLHGLAARDWVMESFELRTLRRIRNWVGVSRWFTDEWRTIAGVTPTRQAVIHNPVDLDVFHAVAAEREPGLVVYAGGLKARKGVRCLAAAARTFLAEAPEARLMLIGFEADVSAAEVQALAGYADRVELRPFMPQQEVAEWMRRASVYAMPSLYESCGNGWMEALACGTPVVGSRQSCGPEIVSHEVTGLLADPNSPTDVARCVLALLRNHRLARQLGEAGAVCARSRFGLSAAACASEEFYRDCLGRLTRRTPSERPLAEAT